ncbi:MAG: sugar transporter [Prevotella sp.]|nr:sugar transporter [Prevotella sp.]
MSERVHRSVMNIKVGMFFYVLSLFLAFFSRKVFLDCLGAEFIGLTGMLMNIMSFLSVAELGIGTSIVYFLYKPLQEDNHEKINEVMSMLAYLYRCIGLVIGTCGIVVSLFFPWWFGNLTTGISLVYFAFYSFLASSVAGYIFNYKQLLVSANQKQYLVNAYFQTIGIVQSLVQILLAYYYRNLYLWVLVGLIFTVIGIIIFNIRIRQLYPWLRINLKEGRQNLKHYPEILRKTRQIFVQKIKDFILYRSDEILVGMFVSVVQVAFYGNYTIITSKLNFLVNILSDGMNAGVGNLVAEGNDKNTMKVFWELTAIRFLIVGIVVLGLLLFLQPFIVCWFGAQYRLSDLIVYLLVFNIFIFLSRGVVEMFISAHGLFSDVWAAWTELFVNLAVTLCLAPFYGIVGILLGKIISVFFIAFFWKPYFLFSRGLHKSVTVYWKGMTPYFMIFALFVAITLFLRYYIIEPQVTTLLHLAGYAIVIYPLLLLFYFFALLVITRGMKYFVARKPTIYNKLKFLPRPRG